MTGQQPIDWLRQNDKSVQSLFNYIPKHLTKSDREKITGYLWEYIADNSGYLGIVNYINKLSWPEQNQVKYAAKAFKNLLMLSIYFDLVVDRNINFLRVKGVPDVKLQHCHAIPQNLWNSDAKSFILVCRGQAGTNNADVWYSVGFNVLDKDELMTSTFSDIKLYGNNWWSINLHGPADLAINIPSITIKTMHVSDLGLE